MQSRITDLFAAVPVSDLGAGIDWYTRFFGRPPDSRVGDEVLWEIDEHAWFLIEPNAARARPRSGSEHARVAEPPDNATGSAGR